VGHTLDLAIGTRDHDDISVRVAEPNLSVSRRRIEVSFLENLGLEPSSALDG